ncbi:hypothetical protein GPECTOR_17g974 [Gonium pectorale]|uniref:phosphoenolpyruvate carboxykinase (ATP) n=1 Tax=Gonium pectorale TaxID=33097 RepID=A0A150GKJ0_GONPE|nr:hypothetical protein GPECTOR_17g974 [Gonium pectorale]|eukprot:KXZ50333.1 hypothetical protein GPECTOR_17g974 [Gonium pectorale]
MLVPLEAPKRDSVKRQFMTHDNIPAGSDKKFITDSKFTKEAGLAPNMVYRNLSPAQLYELALAFEPGTHITSTGALATRSGEKMGRSPKDKRVTRDPETEKDLWWGAHSPNYIMDDRLMHYLMPMQGKLSLHSGCNVGAAGDVTLFFGLSGTGKTTLSADPKRPLIGDDEHVWSDNGVFNIEGGCYAKCIGLKPETEPEIWNAIRFGTVLENVDYDPATREVDYNSQRLTENTRASYPIEYMANARIPCVGGHPKNVILLACDAFGVLPPVSRLTPEQAMYHFISGYTAKVAGTEVGVTEPQATFSACFGSAFLMMHPYRYATMLADKMAKHGTTAWLVNTGWTGGKHGVGRRMSLKHTRAIIDAIHSGELDTAELAATPIFGLQVPKAISGVPSEILSPENVWPDKDAFAATLNKLGHMFVKNFDNFSDGHSFVGADMAARILTGGPSPLPAEDVDAKGFSAIKRA